MPKKGNVIAQAQKKIAEAMVKKEPTWLVATKHWLRANVTDADSLPYDKPTKVAFSMTLAEILDLARHVAEVQDLVRSANGLVVPKVGIDTALTKTGSQLQETKEKTDGP